MTAYTWSGSGNANVTTNWTPNGTPGSGAGDTVVFDGTSTSNCTWNYNPTNALTSLTVKTAYTGTITQTVNIGAFGTSEITTFTLEAGTAWTSTTGQMFLTTAVIDGTYTMGAVMYITNPTNNGTGLSGSGTITGASAWGVFNHTASNLTTSINFTGTDSHTGDTYIAQAQANGGALTVQLTANLTLTSTSLFRTAQISGTTTFKVNGYTITVPRIDIGESPSYGGIFDASTAGSVIACNGTMNIINTSPYILFGSSTWTVTGNWVDRSTSASWSQGTGTLTMTGASPTWRQDSNSNHVYNFRFNGSGTFAPGTGFFRFGNQVRLSAGTVTPTLNVTAVGEVLVDGATFNTGTLTVAADKYSVTSGTFGSSNTAWTMTSGKDLKLGGGTFNFPSTSAIPRALRNLEATGVTTINLNGTDSFTIADTKTITLTSPGKLVMSELASGPEGVIEML